MHRIKAILLFLLVVGLIVPAFALAIESAEDEAYFFDQAKLPQSEAHFIQSITQIQDDFYVYMDDFIVYRWSPQSNLYEKFCELPVMPDGVKPYLYASLSPSEQELVGDTVSYMASDSDVLYGFNRYSGRICVISKDKYEWLDVRLNMASFMDNDSPEAYYYAFVLNGKLYALIGDNQNDSSEYPDLQMIELDIESGHQKRVNLSGIQGACPYQNGILALRITDNPNGSENHVLSYLDMTSLEATDLNLSLPSVDERVSGLAYDAQSDSIYFVTEALLMRSLAGGKFESVLPHGLVHVMPNSPGWILENGNYGVWFGGLYVCNPSENRDLQRVLSIKGNAKNLAAQYNIKKNGDISAIWDNSINLASEIGDAIRSGSADFDIFQLDVDASFTLLKEKGYMAELNSSPQISESLLGLHTAIQNAITKGNNIIAYPEDLSINLWQVNRVKWIEYFGELPVPTTYLELSHAMLLFEQNDAMGDGFGFIADFDYGNMVKQIIYTYIRENEKVNEPIQFQSDALVDTLNGMAQVNAQDIQTRRVRFSQSQQADDALFYPSGGGNLLKEVMPGEPLEYVSILPFAISKDSLPIIPGHLSVLCVNPNSTKQDIAHQYIAYYTKRETDVDLHYRTFADAKNPIANEGYGDYVQFLMEERDLLLEGIESADEESIAMFEQQLESIEFSLAHQDRLKWHISQEGIDAYQEIIPYVQFFDQSLYLTYGGTSYSQIDTLCERYAAGQLALGDFLNSLDTATKTIYMENN